MVRRVLALAGVCIALAVALVTSPVFPAPRASASSTAPAFNGDFPDPDIVNVGGTYYAYSTQVYLTDIPTMHSTDLVHWSPLTDALPQLPSWATWGHTWAPSVLPVGTYFLMYYTVRETASNRQCISEAQANSPSGPFVDTSRGPLICQRRR